MLKHNYGVSHEIKAISCNFRGNFGYLSWYSQTVFIPLGRLLLQLSFTSQLSSWESGSVHVTFLSTWFWNPESTTPILGLHHRHQTRWAMKRAEARVELNCSWPSGFRRSRKRQYDSEAGSVNALLFAKYFIARRRERGAVWSFGEGPLVTWRNAKLGAEPKPREGDQRSLRCATNL